MDVFLGNIMCFAFNFAPKGWMLCNGTIMQIQQYSALYSLIGNKFGGNATTTFALPNLTNDSPVVDMNYFICIMGIYPSRQ